MGPWIHHGAITFSLSETQILDYLNLIVSSNSFVYCLIFNLQDGKLYCIHIVCDMQNGKLYFIHIVCDMQDGMVLVTLRIDPKGYLLYWTDPNQV